MEPLIIQENSTEYYKRWDKGGKLQTNWCLVWWKNELKKRSVHDIINAETVGKTHRLVEVWYDGTSNYAREQDRML